MTSVRVGIVSWNTAGLLDACLAALPEALAGVSYESVVVDNASSDASVAVARAHRDVQVITNDENVGYARGMNQALTVGEPGPVLIALNPDTHPGPGSLAALVRRLDAQRDVGLVAPRLLNVDGSEQHSVHRFPSLAVAAAASFVPRRLARRRLGQSFWLEGLARHDGQQDVDWAIGAVHVVRRAALADPRAPYAEDTFMYAEDLALCWELAERGWRRRLEGDIAIPHVGNASGSQAWSSGRTQQWLAATYDWYRRARGEARARGWAAVNVIGTAWAALRFSVLAMLWPRGRASHRAWARSASESFPLHLLVLRSGTARLVARAQRGRAGEAT